MDRLGYERFAAQGGDWGSMITSALGTAAPEMLIGIHLTMALAPKPDDAEALSAQEKADIRFSKEFSRYGSGYSAEQSTRPQTIGYGLADSPSHSARGSWRSSGTGPTARATRRT